VDAPPPTAPPVAPPPAKPVEEVKEKAPPPPAVAKAKETAIIAPMPGIIIRYEVEVGDEVKANDVVVILEAMKMANAISTQSADGLKS
ncbi:unnamed protein product, partial [marine sediment metagenome]